MGRWPNFFIVGAPRAATTSLYVYLRGHPEIFLPRVKEPNFFSEIDYEGDLEPTDRPTIRFRQEERYLRLFESAGVNQVVGEASPSYLRDEQAPGLIHDKAPDAKIITLLRNPVERAYSDYKRMVQRGVEREPFYEAVTKDYARPKKIWGSARLYVESGLYYEAVKRYQDTFGSAGVRIYLHDDFVSDPAGVVKDICEFLHVPFYDGRFFNPQKIYNTSGAARSPVIRWLWRTRPAIALENWLLRIGTPPVVRLLLRRFLEKKSNPNPPVEKSAKSFLLALYRDDILRLQCLTGRDLSAWLVGYDQGGPSPTRS